MSDRRQPRVQRRTLLKAAGAAAGAAALGFPVVLRAQTPTFNEGFGATFTRFDGTSITL